jgi:hypothetical protein
MRSRDAGQDQIVRRCRKDLAVLDDMAVAVRTFGDPSVVTVQDRFLAACFFGPFRIQNGGQKVQGLAVAVLETLVFAGDALNGFEAVVESTGFSMTQRFPAPSV